MRKHSEEPPVTPGRLNSVYSEDDELEICNKINNAYMNVKEDRQRSGKNTPNTQSNRGGGHRRSNQELGYDNEKQKGLSLQELANGRTSKSNNKE